MQRWPERVSVWVDGASRGNPGKASCGFVVRGGMHPPGATGTANVLMAAGHCMPGGPHTNNEAEYEALIAAAVACKSRGARFLKVYSDSELMIKRTFPRGQRPCRRRPRARRGD